MIRRGAFLGLLALLAAPLASAQTQAPLPRIALVDTAQPVASMVEGPHSPWGALIAELRKLGYVEGKSVTLERWSGAGAGSATAYRELARKVVSSQPQVIVVRSRSMLVHFAAETKEAPIVAIGSISAELRQPNVTGVNASFDSQQLYGKQVEVLGSVLKPGAQVAWIGTRLAWDGTVGEAARFGARSAKLTLHPVLVPPPISRSTIRRAFADIVRAKYDAVLISPVTELYPFRDAVAELAVARGLPSLGSGRLWAEAGALLGYGVDSDQNFRRGAHLVDRLVKGAQPGALPIENPTKVELIVNLETARSLGIAIPQSLLLRADKVIE